MNSFPNPEQTTCVCQNSDEHYILEENICLKCNPYSVFNGNECICVEGYTLENGNCINNCGDF